MDITSRRLYEFFGVELRNERAMLADDGEAPTQTLTTAVESLLQAPLHVLLSWFDLEAMDEQDAVEILLSEFLGLAWLICEHGGDAKLKDFEFKE